MTDDLGLTSGVLDIITLYSGKVLRIHGPKICNGNPCCIHNPSDHSLQQAPLDWRGNGYYMERVCDHLLRHPDPDVIEFELGRFIHLQEGYPELYESLASRVLIRTIHVCDGCCGERPTESTTKRGRFPWRR